MQRKVGNKTNILTSEKSVKPLLDYSSDKKKKIKSNQMPEAKTISRKKEKPALNTAPKAKTEPSKPLVNETKPSGSNGRSNTSQPKTYQKSKKKSKKPLAIVLIIIGVLLAIYFAGVLIIGSSFLPNTYLNGRNVSLLSAEAASNALYPDGQTFKIKELDGAEETIALDDINYKTTLETPMSKLIERQTPYAWPLALFSKTEMDDAVTTTIDDELLQKALNSLDAFDVNKVTPPSDAHLERNADGNYEIIAEVEGNELDSEKTFNLVKEAILTGQSEVDLVENECYHKPTIYKDDQNLANQLKVMQKLNSETITIDLTGATETLTTEQLADLVTLNSDGSVEANYEAIYAYVAELAEKYDTYMTTRLFTTHSGKVVEVGGYSVDGVSNDTYGFLMNQDNTAYYIAEAILSGESQTIEPSWDVPALTRDDVNGDIGTTYVEVSLDEQHLWYYVDGKLVTDCDVVTGLTSDARRATPAGCFRIWQKDKDATLTGQLDNSKWETKVGLFMAITWTGIGLHDATWRYSFGGDIYTYDGSHGCINMPYDPTKIIFESAELDTPCIIY